MDRRHKLGVEVGKLTDAIAQGLTSPAVVKRLKVAKAFPELVIYDEERKPETVSYHLLATLLLNEFQKEHAIVHSQAERIAELERQAMELAQLKEQVARMAQVINKLDHSEMVAATQ